MRTSGGSLTFGPHSVSGCFGTAISTTLPVKRISVPSSITLTRWMHRLSSSLVPRYPQDIQTHGDAREPNRIARSIPAKPRQTRHSGRYARSKAEHSPVKCTEIRLVGVRVVHMPSRNAWIFRPRSRRGKHAIDSLPSNRSFTYPGWLVSIRISRNPHPACDSDARITDGMHSVSGCFPARLSTPAYRVNAAR